MALNERKNSISNQLLYSLHEDIDHFLKGVLDNEIYLNNKNEIENDNLINKKKRKLISSSSSTLSLHELELERLRSELSEEKLLRERDQRRFESKLSEVESERDQLQRRLNFLISEEETMKNEFKKKLKRLNEENLNLKQKLSEVKEKLSSIYHSTNSNEVELNDKLLANQRQMFTMQQEIDSLQLKVDSISKEKILYVNKVEILKQQLQKNGSYHNNSNNNNNLNRSNEPKILHFKMNPYDMALQEMANESNLNNSENNIQNQSNILGRNDLNAPVDSDGFQGPSFMLTPGSTPKRSSSLNSVASDKLNKRLKEIFRKRIDFFRECVYLISGYKIDLNTNHEHPQVRLRSMYAESESDYILFQWRDGELDLISTPFIQSLNQDLFQVLSTTNSIPAFLSNITLDLFERQTFL